MTTEIYTHDDVMYGLFENSYDYYKWHELIAVSRSQDNLIDYASDSEIPLLLSEDEQECAEKAEERHLVIEAITEV